MLRKLLGAVFVAGNGCWRHGMNVSSALAVLLLTTSLDAAAKDSVVTGAGAFTCAEFGQYYKLAPQETDRLFYTWAQGFMSGMNFQARTRGEAWRNIGVSDSTSQMFKLRSYCSDNPLKRYLNAVWTFYLSLPTMAD